MLGDDAAGGGQQSKAAGKVDKLERQQIAFQRYAEDMSPKKFKIMVRNITAVLVATGVAGMLVGIIIMGIRSAIVSYGHDDAIAALKAEHQASVKNQTAQLKKVTSQRDGLAKDKANLERELEIARFKYRFVEHHFRYVIASEVSDPNLRITHSLYVRFLHRALKSKDSELATITIEPMTKDERDRSDLLNGAQSATDAAGNRIAVDYNIIRELQFSDGTRYIVPFEIADAVRRKGK